MRFRTRLAGGFVLALAATTALGACSSSSTSPGGTPTTHGTTSGNTGGSTALPGQYGTVPAPGTDTGKSGTITFAELTTQEPTWIFPVEPSANTTTYDLIWFIQEMWRPLYWTTNGVHPADDPQFDIANAPVYSNNDQTVTFTLKSQYKWSDGQPVTSADVVFLFDEIKASLAENPANWGQYTPQLGIPDEVKSISAPDASTVVMNLTKSVNPTWWTLNELGLLNPIPAHAWAKASATGPTLDYTNPANAKKIYDFLAAQAKDTSTYPSNPLWKVVDGPYTLTSYNATNGDWNMAPNPAYGGPHAKTVLPLNVIGYASTTALFNAIKANAVDIAQVPSADAPQVQSITGNYNDFGYPAFGFNYVAYNFLDKTGDFDKIIGQLYFRQAFAHLEDEQGIIRAIYDNAAGPAYGPVPAIPSTPYTPSTALSNPFPFSIATAVSILKAHGWTVNPGGTDVCSSPGTGASNCGPGIPAGTKLEFNFIYNTDSSVIPELAQNLASDARQAGITMDLQTSNFNTMVSTYNDPAAPKNDNKWAMEDYGGFSISSYPTMLGIFNTPASLNTGGYSDPQADSLMNASIASSNPAAVSNESAYLVAQQPGLFQPLQDRIWVWPKNLSGPAKGFQTLTQFYLNPELMFFTS
jgi:peptide/nickel transport system substrate-binding protein